MDKPAPPQPTPPPPGSIQVQIEPTEAEGIYANLVLLAHSPSEFILDFARMMPGAPRAKVYSRIILTPQNARSLLRALEQRIEQYEAQFGKIRVQGETPPARDIGFKPETP
ncbi:MAG: DUF3467 domain-containing protein [Candidatus Eisenbacteria bacterium]|nr:DUF3467 domain-containing protein [Candidatus Eisenbacteria bacterium]